MGGTLGWIRLKRPMRLALEAVVKKGHSLMGFWVVEAEEGATY
jgi:hypothetical protein